MIVSGGSERASSSARLYFAGAVGLSILYLLVWLVAASGLTFYWDDYFLILSQHDRSFVESLVAGINGNWWPFATVLQRAEVWLFGPWYAGYLLVNAVLSLAIVWLVWFTLAPIVRLRWLLFAGLALYACSLGVLVNVSVMTASWPLSVVLAALTALLLVRRKPAVAWILTLVLCLLADSGLFAINAAIIAAIVLGSRVAADPERAFPSAREVVNAGLLVVAGLAGTLAGKAIASRHPIDYLGSSGIADQGGPLVPTIDVGAAVQSVVSFAIPWLASPLVPGSAIRNSFLTWQVVLVSAHIMLVTLGLVAAAAVAVVVVRRSSDRRHPIRILMLGAVFAVPVLETAVILTTVRSGIGYAPRYALVWLLPAVLLWVTVLSPNAVTSFGRVIAGAGRTLLVVSALAAVLLTPVTTRSAIDTDNERWAHSANQLEQMRACLRGEVAIPDPDVSPGINAADFCRFVRYVRDSSLLGGLLD